MRHFKSEVGESCLNIDYSSILIALQIISVAKKTLNSSKKTLILHTSIPEVLRVYLSFKQQC